MEDIDQEFMVEDSSEDSLKSIDEFDFDDADYDDTSDGVTISRKEGDLETWISDEEVDQGIDVEWQDDPYHLVDDPEEPEKISNMFAEIDQALDVLDDVVAAEEVTEMYVIFLNHLFSVWFHLRSLLKKCLQHRMLMVMMVMMVNN